MTPGLLVGFLVGGPVPIPLLRPGRGGWVLFDALDDIVCRPGGVVVTGELGTFIEDWFEEAGDELPLTGFPDIRSDFPPHVGHEDDVF